MTKAKYLLLMLAVLTALGVMPAFAQTATPFPPLLPLPDDETINVNANITFPPPVYVLRGLFEIRGSANLPSMTTYFLEYRPYGLTFEIAGDQVPWFPVSLPSNAAVQNDVLATWDTTTVPDGVYELRLTVNAGASIVQQIVRPLRVENEIPPFLATPVVITQVPNLIPTLTLPAQQQLPTQPPPPTIAPTLDATPRATINTANANVRGGDSTFFGVINSFPQGTVFVILGRSANNTGWFQIQLPNGGTGWIAPSVVNVTGNVNNLPRIQPPPPPITPTFTPVPATATPITQANLVAGIVSLEPGDPECGETFTVGFDVANLGSGTSTSSGIVTLQDTVNGATQASTTGGFPVLNPGQTFRVLMPLTVTTNYDVQHIITLTIDPQGQVPETNDGDNVRTFAYVLEQGGCNA